MQQLSGKKALVTGASRGIGRAIAVALADAGADVAITYENSQKAAESVVTEITSKGRKSVAIKANSGNPQDVKHSVDEAAAKLGGLDILVNNAGIFTGGSFENLTLEDLDKIIAVNIKGVVLACQAALNHMKSGGRIITVGSCLGEHVPRPGLTIYSMTKSALVSLTKGLARDLGPKGITVNLVEPGPIDTDMNPVKGDSSNTQVERTALGHYGKPEDIAHPVVFLASDASKYMTGSIILVDGGTNA